MGGQKLSFGNRSLSFKTRELERMKGRSKRFASCKPYAPNQIDYGNKNVEINSGTATFSVFFCDSIITHDKITASSYQHLLLE